MAAIGKAYVRGYRSAIMSYTIGIRWYSRMVKVALSMAQALLALIQVRIIEKGPSPCIEC